MTEAHGRYGDLGYTYDEAGNRVSRTHNGLSEPYTYAADSHHLLQSVAGGTRNYGYDANGNTTDNTDYGFVYGDHGRLTAVTQVGAPLATYTYNGRGERVRKLVGEEAPDYTALAAEQEALAAAYRTEAETTKSQAQALEDSAQAKEAQAAEKQAEAETLRQAAAAHRSEAQGLDRQAATRERNAAKRRALAKRFRSRLIEPPRNPKQRLLNARYRALAKRSEAKAAAISAEARRLRVEAQALRDAAGTKERQAQTLDAEATKLLAEATEAKEQAARLRTEADALIAKAIAAEALAADYRALASNPPSARVVTHYRYDQEGRLLGEYDEEGHVQREYVYLEGMPLALITPTGIYYYHTDHLGTPQSLTDSDQTVVWQAHYDPFGRASVTTQPVVNNLRFPGQYFDAETGLHYNYFRDYDPSIGRYVQSDPIGLRGGINTYTYVGSNPLTRIDPTGEFAFVLPAIPPALAALGEAAAFVGSAALAGYALSEIVGDEPAELSENRSIPTPARPQCGCTCTCRADADDRIPGNVKPGLSRFAFGTATASNCAEASKEAKRIATRNLGMQPKHVPCRCTGRKQEKKSAMKLHEPHDHAGKRVEIGDRIVVRAIPQELIHDLPEEDVEAIGSQIGKTLVISGFNEYGYVELDFVDSVGTMHTIWIEPAYLEKQA